MSFPTRKAGVEKKARRRSSRPPQHTGERNGLLTVGQAARLIGISPSTLRVWESVGLVTPARSNGRFRLYSLTMLEELKRIKYLRDVKRLGIPGIKEALGRESPEEKQEDERPHIGPKLRRMRERSNLSVAEAARHAGISPGFLSSIELSRAHPSVATLQRLTAAYGTTILEFYDLPKRASQLVHVRDRKSLVTKGGVRMEVLSFGTTLLECMLFQVPPGAGSEGAYSHTGEEFIYMLSGELEVWLDEIECYSLVPGDSLWFKSTSGHRFVNPHDREAVLIWVNTPPTF